MAIVEGQARYEALLTVFCASRRYVHDASAPLHPLPRHHASRKKVIVEQTLEVRGDQDDEQVQLGSIGLTIHIPPRDPANLIYAAQVALLYI